MSSRRMVRVDALLLRELAMLCEQRIAPDAEGLVTITKVHCSPDLREAMVFVSVLGSDEQRAQAMRLMHAARKDLQHEIGRRVILKYTPRLVFREDRTAAQADRILGILDELQLPEDSASPPPPDAEDV